ncbi:MAG: STAS domain-containing protein [Hydrogenimonas sp.]|nr:MAG: STAS domain-containing protein [Hydrogenimonas sp.]
MGIDKVAISRKQISVETPLITTEITDNCLYSGFFGSLDSTRVAEIADKITLACEAQQFEYIIIDLGNVEAIDSAVATHLLRLGDVLSLIGVQPIFCGIHGMLARTMVASGVSMGHMKTVANLKSALKLCYELSGLELVKK